MAIGRGNVTSSGMCTLRGWPHTHAHEGNIKWGQWVLNNKEGECINFRGKSGGRYGRNYRGAKRAVDWLGFECTILSEIFDNKTDLEEYW